MKTAQLHPSRIAIRLVASMAVVAIASPGCATATPASTQTAAAIPFEPGAFEGAWSTQWCDRTAPDAECGGFTLYLAQDGDRLCGTFFGARPRLSQVDDGGPRALVGVAVDRKAVLTVRSSRNHAIRLATAAHRGNALEWDVVGTVQEPGLDDIDIIATRETLTRLDTPVARETLGDVRAQCRAPTQD